MLSHYFHKFNTEKDDASVLDLATMRRWNLILRIFMAEYLHLRPHDLNTRTDSSTLARSDSELVSNAYLVAIGSMA